MTRRKTILTVLATLVTLSIASFAIAISYDSPCPAAASLPAGAARMRAIVHRCYGASESLSYEEIEKPVAGEGRILVKVHAASVNPYDWHVMTGKPYIMRMGVGFGAPDYTRTGVDFAGTVESVGKNVTRFKPGDEVFGAAGGAFADYVTPKEEGSIARKPPELSFEQAAAIPIAAVTALQALRDQGRIQPGQKVLINGASGGVGTFAIQIAKSFGAQVTAVCSTKNVELVRSLGADHVIDYTRENFTGRAERYHMILDNVGNHPILDLRRVLEPKGILVMVGGPKGPWIEPFLPLIKGAMLSPFVDERFVFFIAQINQGDLNLLADLARAGKMQSVVGQRFRLNEVPAALEYLGGRHARGKLIVRME